MTNEEITLKILSERVRRRLLAGDHEADAMAFVAGELCMMLAMVANIAMSDHPQDAQYYLRCLMARKPSG